MTKSPEELTALLVGGATVEENLRRAIEAGTVIENADGTLQLARDQQPSPRWAGVSHGPPLGCWFLKEFLFHQAYSQSAVPYGCSACYKVKVIPRTLRELVAAWEIGSRIECKSKWGIDFGNPYSQNVYAGYLYASGLDAARITYKVVREAIDQNLKLGPDISMTIKRGCSEYEVELGPSDRYEFAPEMAELETYLKRKFRNNAGEAFVPINVAMVRWIEVAFQMGDDTYLDFTGGKRLCPKTVTYDP